MILVRRHVLDTSPGGHFQRNVALGDVQESSFVHVVLQRCVCPGTAEPDVVGSANAQRWPQQPVELLKSFGQTRFQDELVIVVTEVPRGRVRAHQRNHRLRRLYSGRGHGEYEGVVGDGVIGFVGEGFLESGFKAAVDGGETFQLEFFAQDKVDVTKAEDEGLFPCGRFVQRLVCRVVQFVNV